MKPYHVQMLVQNPKKFGISERQIKTYLRLKVKDWGVYDDKDRIEGAVDDWYNNLLEGDTDIDKVVEIMAMKKGWCRFVDDRGYISVQGYGKLDNLRTACIILDAQQDVFSSGKLKSLELSLQTMMGKTKATSKKRWMLREPLDIRRWFKVGGDPNRLPKESGERQSVVLARMIGRYPPGSDEWGPIKGRGFSKKHARRYEQKNHPFKSFREFIGE
jgi:hypothetical protein